MKAPELSRIRNLGIISHIDAGKTTVSERILFYTGETHKLGEVHEGTAVMDWMPQEQERGITITATSTACRWRDHWLNLIDTPGHIDFTIEVERSLRVLDGAVAIFSAVEGVQPQSESVWRQADRYRVPRICLINKLDRVGADVDAVVRQIGDKLAARAILLQLPWGVEGAFRGVIDVLAQEALSFSEDDQGAEVTRRPIPDELAAAARAARDRAIEAAADFDDEVMADFVEGRAPSLERVRTALRRGTLACRLYPTFLGSALRNKGIQPLLDGVIEYLPSPLETPPVEAREPDTENRIELPCDPLGPLCALAFKVLSDEGRKLTYLRLYSGRIVSGDVLLNSTRGGEDRLARLFLMHAHKRERIDEARAGDIVAATGLKDVLTGDTLCRPERPLLLAGLTLPEPVVSVAVEARAVDDRERLIPALEKLQWEDPTFRVREDAETGQTILTGMGELHLEVVVDRLARDFGVEVKTGRPQVVFRETLTRSRRHHEIFDREIDGRRHQGEVLLLLEPLARNSGLEIAFAPGVAEALPAPWRTLVEDSLRQACRGGVRTGYPLTDVRILVEEAPLVAGHTTELGLRAAAQRGFSRAAREAAPTLLEPVMALELTAPADYTGKVLGALPQKRGQVEGMLSRGDTDVIRAKVPLVEMFGYMTELRSATKGRGSYSLEFSHFDQAPAETLRRFGL
ncbi:translation elongation factor 2 (EF-2/EF-G) [Geoalkalibacter ferrihydriticus]|uniref:Elongation factor G n=2 Tax=Geoalkalibacter ferrihydriticus TaxID=392333 RepID=A0A0C2HYL9_9BACT|nr:elongation factor G [Geoalkalibacter ferrihydriticus]KIH77852.1 elongation factor G [Geoalkalibacter ferrihydriticus DSM 17813]SDL82678.1 translation elongation factor 2 (EF-2/EF-G) [Geoalkalibacter ferrihydriticus]